MKLKFCHYAPLEICFCMVLFFFVKFGLQTIVHVTDSLPHSTGSVLTEHSSLLSTATATSPSPPSSVGSVQYRDDADCMCSSVCGCCGDRKCTVL